MGNRPVQAADIVALPSCRSLHHRIRAGLTGSGPQLQYAMHFIADLTLHYGRVLHDYNARR
jgi:acetoacetate decarboxylase